MNVPILFLGDSPDLRTGLGRIGRDLATLLCRAPEFRVGYLGRGGKGSRQLPFAQYYFPETEQWGENMILPVWEDFAGDQSGVIFSIWDASRLHWFSQPHPRAMPAALLEFLKSGRFQRWGYFPVDATGPGEGMTTIGRETLLGFNRVLAYTVWGAQVIEKTIGGNVEHIPHGINLNVWKPRDRKGARICLGFGDRDFVIGCNMANQARKDWGLAFDTLSRVRELTGTLRAWLHTDIMSRSHAWDLHALVHDFGLAGCVRITESDPFLTDETLSYFYSACDVTILPSPEGFGYPIAESLACGVPVVHGACAGGAELVPCSGWLVDPIAWRWEGIWNSLRPVHHPAKWAATILGMDRANADFCRASVEHLDWSRLWPSAWEKWFLGGLGV